MAAQRSSGSGAGSAQLCQNTTKPSPGAPGTNPEPARPALYALCAIIRVGGRELGTIAKF